MNNYNPEQTTPFSIKYKLKSRLWGIINATFYRYSPFFMLKYRVWLTRIFGSKISWNCSLSNKSTIIDSWNLIMADFSSLGDFSCVRCRDIVKIGKYTCIGRGVQILSASHNIYSHSFEMIKSPIIIKDNVWIATNSIISKGVIIGHNSVIAAGSVVVKNVEDNNIVGGNPAKFIKRRFVNEV